MELVTSFRVILNHCRLPHVLLTLRGTDADSNILKIYRMLDRSNGIDEHYYQPGIGTYVNTHNLSHTSVTTRLISWYKKAKDSAVGTSFDSHVMGGYKFLMRCYQDDDIYIFGFSRGAYVARFLAEMLDHVGLLSRGIEEMCVIVHFQCLSLGCGS